MTTAIVRPTPAIRLVDTYRGTNTETIGSFAEVLAYVRDRMHPGHEVDRHIRMFHQRLLDALEAEDLEAARAAGVQIDLRIEQARTVITEPGLYDLDAADYHSDPVPGGSLSQSRAKLLLEEGGPAKFRHRESAPREHKPEWDFGTTVHAVALGKGMERIVEVDYATWQGKAAQQERDAARAKGLTPVLARDMRQAEAMAEALTQHSQAMEVLAGQPEVAVFARDESGLWLRGQMDIYEPGSHIGDYKTAADASSRGFSNAVWKFRYHMQAAWYRTLVAAVTGELLPYRLVAQEKSAPFLVSVWEPTRELLDMGRADMTDAITTYLQCVDSGEWPGYPDAIQPLTPPDWAMDDEIEV